MTHFISGLPRSGSTLLAAILAQNPKLSTGITTPVGDLFSRALVGMGANSEYRSMISDLQRIAILRGIFYGFHLWAPGRVIIDTNRYWCSRVPLLAKVFPTSKVLVCVREPQWIFESFERQLRANPLMASKLYPGENAANVYSRADYIAHPVHGVLGFAWHSTKEAYFGAHNNRMYIVDYECLARDPEKELDFIYDFLEIPRFKKHDFDDVKQLPEVKKFDAELGLPGLHTVRSKVAFVEQKSVLPPDLFKKLSWPVFWRGGTQ